MMLENLKKNSWKLLFTMIFIFLLGNYIFSYSTQPYVLSQSELKARSDLENELKRLKPIPGATYQSVNSSFKDHSSRWERIYFTSDLEFEDVCDHYDKLLQTNGWRKLEWNSSQGWENTVVKYSKAPSYFAEIRKFPDVPHKYWIEFQWSGGLKDIIHGLLNW